ncbi:MAG TPA: DUF4382 domain-containing protein [Candidatus Acidoferrales bacterium]|nr:DUF4382 domain-containing protein [Candidatus Acidoferrales bacterium]
MKAIKFPRVALGLFAIIALLVLAGCGGGGSSSSPTPVNPTPQTGTVSVVVSDDSTDDWAVIGVKVLKIELIPQGGGSSVTVYTAPATPPVFNLVQLDQLSELLGQVSIQAGTYTAAKLTLSANPGDVTLTAANDPEAGFPLAAATTVPTNQIQIVGTQGSTGSLTVPLTINFSNPLVVSQGNTTALDMEFDLSHPAFIVQHTPASGSTLWAVNFNGPVRRHVIADLRKLLLRDPYGQVNSVSTDNTYFTMTRVHPTYPVASTAASETAVTGSTQVNIYADSVNGTLFYDVDAKTKTNIKDFSSVNASSSNPLTNKYVRVVARYQQNGTLVAARVYTSSTFGKVWLSPEGHVLHVNKLTNIMRVATEDGSSMPIQIDDSTQFFFRVPDKAQSDTTSIGTGTAWFEANVVRGFKVHVAVRDVTAAQPWVADSVDIEDARFSGTISGATSTDFTYTRNFPTVGDDYVTTLDYISSSTANGTDDSGNAINGYKWWYLLFPSNLDSGTNAVSDFVSATAGAANFGGTIGAIPAWGMSNALWGDPSDTSGWSANWTILTPVPLPRGNVSSAWATVSNGGTFGLSVPGGAQSVTVDLSTVTGSATLVYQVDRTNGIITITPKDLTNATDLQAVQQALVVGTPVKAFGVPAVNGSVKAYVLFYYTGTTLPM